jgi:Ca2+-binding RTX toxin-like protein
MPTFYGTPESEVFLLGHNKADVTVYADGVDDGSGTKVPTLNVQNLNVIMSGKGNDRLYGGYGSDNIFGHGGDDVIYGSGGGYAPTPSASGAISRRDGADHLDGGAGNDTIYGNGGDDTILGGAGDDLIYGGTGHNTVHGGSGNDTIYNTGDTWGGAGRDTFVFRFTGSVSSDLESVPRGVDNTIHDFRSGVDKIDLSQGFVTAAGVEVVNTGQGIELHYVSAYIEAQINLAGVHRIEASDIIYNGDIIFA